MLTFVYTEKCNLILVNIITFTEITNYLRLIHTTKY